MDKKRICQKIKINDIDGMKVIYGTTDRYNPIPIYADFNCYVIPCFDVGQSEELKNFEKKIKWEIKSLIRKYGTLKDKIIFDISYTTAKIKKGSAVNLSMNLFFAQTNSMKLPSFEINGFCHEIAFHAIDILSDLNFIVGKTRKDAKATYLLEKAE